MNVLLLVVDSLRAAALCGPEGTRPRTPFLDRLGAETIHFRRAYATECWTLPTHCSIFTGLLPSQHGAHFHSMAYHGEAPTIAELLAAAGYDTEVVTRNFIFDGTLPGITRGFRRHTQLLSDAGALNPFALLLGLAKPRFRRHLKRTGFFHPLQRESRQFLATFARAMMPADRRSLTYLLERLLQQRQTRTPYFFFCNLYDVHAPYPPTPRSILRSFRTARGWMENLMFPGIMSALGTHRYLRADFHLSDRGRQMLLGRYHRAIELMDAKLEAFYTAARSAGLLDDTLLILTSDHGEAFGEHRLYLHDASVYDTHLHVPLWITHPEHAPATVDDIVSTRDLFGLMRRAALDGQVSGTILDPAYRAVNAVALAEHFHYAHADGMLPLYRQNIAAAIAGQHKIIIRREGVEHYDLAQDPEEATPANAPLGEFAVHCRRDGATHGAVADAMSHLGAWLARAGN